MGVASRVIGLIQETKGCRTRHNAAYYSKHLRWTELSEETCSGVLFESIAVLVAIASVYGHCVLAILQQGLFILSDNIKKLPGLLNLIFQYLRFVDHRFV